MIHELKTDSAVFQAVKEGRKNFEIRRNDKHFVTGDLLVLKETENDGADMAEFGLPLIYTGEELVVTVEYVLYGPIYGLEAGWCIMSISL